MAFEDKKPAKPSSSIGTIEIIGAFILLIIIVIWLSGQQTQLTNDTDVTVQGTVQSRSDGSPDAGAVLRVNATTFGLLDVYLPGFVECRAANIYLSATGGDRVEISGHYKDGAIRDVCSSPTYYVRKVDSQ